MVKTIKVGQRRVHCYGVIFPDVIVFGHQKVKHNQVCPRPAVPFDMLPAQGFGGGLVVKVVEVDRGGSQGFTGRDISIFATWAFSVVSP
jgi:hypothetical protein